MPTPPTIIWAHVGDLHADAADGWQGTERLSAIVAELNGPIGRGTDFVFLPGDNANHGLVQEYARILAGLAPLTLPWRMIPGDHDFEPGDLAAYLAAIPPANRPDQEVIADHRCFFLDVVSAGLGGPDFRPSMHDRRRLAEQLARAEAEGQGALIFTHAFPGDLAADADEVARLIADGSVAFVDTGHTHYNELLNDGCCLYGATRSTAQIEEGPPGYSLHTVRDGVVAWHFRELGDPRPVVRILAPADQRLVTRPADPRQVPRPGAVRVVAAVVGEGAPVLHVTGDRVAMARDGGEWHATVTLTEGLHDLRVTAGAGSDAIELLVRPTTGIPKRPPAYALGRECHRIGAWRERGILGTRLGPNASGGTPS
jgi:hypothetical protein